MTTPGFWAIGHPEMITKMKMFNQRPDVMTVAQAAEALQLSRNTVYKLVRNGQLLSLAVGRKILLPKPFLVDFVMRSAPTVLDNGQAICYNPGHDAIEGEYRPVGNGKETL